MFKPAPPGKALALGGVTGTAYGSRAVPLDGDVVDFEGSGGFAVASSRVSAAILGEQARLPLKFVNRRLLGTAAEHGGTFR